MQISYQHNIMKSKFLQFSILNLLISLLFHLSTSVTPNNNPLLPSLLFPLFDQETFCNLTLFPNFCKSLLLNHPNNPKTIQDYTKNCMGESLSKANELNSLVNKYLQIPSHSNSYALKDCQYLINLNVDFLSTSSKIINSIDTLNRDDIDYVQTMLSAIMTNLNTCSDGLEFSEPGSSLVQDFSPHFTNNSMLFSVNLAFFTHGWVTNFLSNLFSGIINPNGLPLNLGFLLKGASYSKNWKKVFYELGLCGIKVNKMVVVNQDGSGDFTTITEAVKNAPNNTRANNGYFGIYVVSGVYEEYVNIPNNKTYLLMVGDGINQTIITGDRSVGTSWTTFNSATFAVTATGFVAVDITFRNTAGPSMHQAVALRSGADLSAFYRCSFEGYQDTLYTHSMRQFYKQCDIYGTVDFIFGNAAVIFQDCNIYPRQPLKGQFNPITAQGREDPNQNTGTIIHHCNIRPTSDLASSNFTVETYLGRPWKAYSRTVYMQTFMDSLINSAGWHEWNGTFALDTLYYAEFNNIGPGSSTSNRVTWPGYHVINIVDAYNFTVSNFILGDYWLPSTGVPYNRGFYYI